MAQEVLGKGLDHGAKGGDEDRCPLHRCHPEGAPDPLHNLLNHGARAWGGGACLVRLRDRHQAALDGGDLGPVIYLVQTRVTSPGQERPG